MSVKSLRRSADNRKAHNLAEIGRYSSPLAQLRRAVNWVMSEAKSMDRDDIPAVVEQIKTIARDLNERSRP